MTKKILALAIGTALFSGCASAADVKFSGYGSVRGGSLTDDNYVPPSFGYVDEVDFKNESIFALQASAQLNKDWSATVVMQARGENDFDVLARWAYVNYKAAPSTTLTMGRFALPFFRSSDSQDIGYSHNYIRMPISVYNKQDFAAIEGVRLTHGMAAGEGDLVFKASYGNFNGVYDEAALGSVPLKLENIMQLSVEYTWEWLTLFAGYFQTDTTVAIDPLLNGLVLNSVNNLSALGYAVENNEVLNPDGASVYDMRNIYLDDDKVGYATLSLAIEYEIFSFNAEISDYKAEDSFGTGSIPFYISAGYRVDDFVFSLVHQKFDTDSRSKWNQSKSTSDDLVATNIDFTVAAITDPGLWDSSGFHIRYDAMAGIAYKAEFTYIHGEQADENVGLVTLGVDFVF